MDTSQDNINKGGRARERHKKRKERQAMVVRGGEKRTNKTKRQIRAKDSFKLPSVTLPQNRLIIGIPLGIMVIIGAIVILALFKNDEPEALANAIWVDKTWTYGTRSNEELQTFADQLHRHQIGKIYAYVSTLNINNVWSGGNEGTGSFMQSRDSVANFVLEFRQTYPTAQLYGWIEVWTNLDVEDGYRLDEPELQANVADFSLRMVEELGFDGVFLDVKPIFTENEDLLRLIRTVRASVGLDTPIIIAVPADLTPEDETIEPLAEIAPGTILDNNFKQRVLLSANEIVITVYQSYRNDPIDYINWVAYQVETYLNIINDLTTDTRIMISVPNYQTVSDAHNPNIETIAAGLDGINVALDKLDEDMQSLLTGVAIFSDSDLTDTQWDIYRQKWLNR